MRIFDFINLSYVKHYKVILVSVLSSVIENGRLRIRRERYYSQTIVTDERIHSELSLESRIAREALMFCLLCGLFLPNYAHY